MNPMNYSSTPLANSSSPASNSGDVTRAGTNLETLFFGTLPPLNANQPAGPITTLSLGGFKALIDGPQCQQKRTFTGKLFEASKWDHIPNFMLFHILDQRCLGYSDDKIATIWKLSSIPPSEVIYDRLHLCSVCGQLGHLGVECPPEYSMISEPISHTAHSNLETGQSSIDHLANTELCVTCLSTTHSFFECPARMIYSVCGLLGHRRNQCGRTKIICMFWRVGKKGKINPVTGI